ncbi:MAG: hypothetical protein ABI378_09520 [Chitinophagaceae bacterium]
MKKPIQKPPTGYQISDNPLLLLLEEKKELIKAIRAGKRASPVPTVWERIEQKNG